MLRKCFFAAMATMLVASSVNAAVIVGLAIDPNTTAGAGSNSTRSGNGTWHLYAIDNTPGSSGISSFDVTVTSSASMAVNNRAPSTNYDADGQGTTVGAGFSLLKNVIGNNTPVVELTGAQPTPPSADSSGNVSVDYFPISGYGQTAASFATKYSAAIAGPTVGASWGAYTPANLSTPQAAAANPTGLKWVFLGEGTYTGTAPTAVASMTIYNNFANTFASVVPAGGSSVVVLPNIPEPATIALFGLAFVGSFGFLRRRS